MSPVHGGRHLCQLTFSVAHVLEIKQLGKPLAATLHHRTIGWCIDDQFLIRSKYQVLGLRSHVRVLVIEAAANAPILTLLIQRADEIRIHVHSPPAAKRWENAARPDGMAQSRQGVKPCHQDEHGNRMSTSKAVHPRPGPTLQSSGPRA